MHNWHLKKQQYKRITNQAPLKKVYPLELTAYVLHSNGKVPNDYTDSFFFFLPGRRKEGITTLFSVFL